jgi:hypothetical protein
MNGGGVGTTLVKFPMDVPMYLWAREGYFDIEFPKKMYFVLS